MPVRGIDSQTIALVEGDGVSWLLDELAADLKETYRPLAARGLIRTQARWLRAAPVVDPPICDRIVQAVTKLVVEPVFEADFLPCSFGVSAQRGRTMLSKPARGFEGGPARAELGGPAGAGHGSIACRRVLGGVGAGLRLGPGESGGDDATGFAGGHAERAPGHPRDSAVDGDLAAQGDHVGLDFCDFDGGVDDLAVSGGLEAYLAGEASGSLVLADRR